MINLLLLYYQFIVLLEYLKTAYQIHFQAGIKSIPSRLSSWLLVIIVPSNAPVSAIAFFIPFISLTLLICFYKGVGIAQNNRVVQVSDHIRMSCTTGNSRYFVRQPRRAGFFLPLYNLMHQSFTDKNSGILSGNSGNWQAGQGLHYPTLASGYKYRTMKTRTTLNYYAKIKSLLAPPMFNFVKNSLENSSNEQLEAFWHIVVAGYPIDFALDNYRKLHEFLKNSVMDYTEAMDTYISYPGMETGMQLVKTRWYELN